MILDYYNKEFPKSLGREWVEDTVFPVLNNYKIPNHDLLTLIQHIRHANFQSA